MNAPPKDVARRCAEYRPDAKVDTAGRDPSAFELELRELAAHYSAEAEHAEQAARECLQWAAELRRQRAKTRVSAGD